MSLLTSAPVSELAVELLARQLVLPATINRVPQSEYRGPSGGTVTIAVPQPRDAREQESRAAAIDYDALSEVGVDVTVKHYYSGALCSDEEVSLDLRDFGRQVLVPQVEAVARAAEDEVADVLNSITAYEGAEWASDDEDPAAADIETILAVRAQLTDNGVPAADRWCACSPSIANRMLANPRFVEADKRGSANALESAEIGTLYGIRFVESPAIDEGTAVFYHRSGIVLGTMPPVAPGGGADSSTAEAGGITLRVVVAFDAGHLATAVVTSVFAGCSLVPENTEGTTIKRAIKVVTGT